MHIFIHTAKALSAIDLSGTRRGSDTRSWGHFHCGQRVRMAGHRYAAVCPCRFALCTANTISRNAKVLNRILASSGFSILPIDKALWSFIVETWCGLQQPFWASLRAGLCGRFHFKMQARSNIQGSGPTILLDFLSSISPLLITSFLVEQILPFSLNASHSRI